MKRKARLLKKTLTLLDLPEELDALTPRLTLVGRDSLLVENHRGVLRMSRELCTFATGEGCLEVRGEGLLLSALTEERAWIRGKLSELKYVDV